MRKEMMKKYVVVILMLTLAVLCIGCGNSSKESEDTQKEQQAENVKDENTEDDNLTKNVISAAMVKEATVTAASEFEYEKIDGGISIIGYSGTGEIVVIPEKIEGNEVIHIGKDAFLNNTIMKGVRLPDTLQIVGENAFGNCFELQVVVCGEELQIIEEYAFNYCQALHTVEFNENLMELKPASFTYAKSLKEIYIPKNVSIIEYAFSGLNDTLTIITEPGSAAEQYAKEEGIPCKTE